MNRIHALAGTVLALTILSFAGCANDAGTVEMAAASTINNRSENIVLNASVKNAIEALKNYNSLASITGYNITGDLSEADFNALKASLQALPPLAYGGKCVELNFSGAKFPGNALPDGAFKDCHNLIAISLPQNLTKIGSWALNSTGIENITIPAGVKEIGTNAFAGTPITSVVIPEGVTTLAGTFNGCSRLSSVTIPSSVTAFKDVPDTNDTEDGACGTFKNCRNLSSINYGGTKAQWNNISKGTLTFKNSSVFKATCTDGQTYAVPFSASVSAAVTAIQNSNGSVPVVITGNLKSSDFGVLKEVIGSASANISLDLSGVTIEGNEIPEEAFTNCPRLTEVLLPNGITKIGTWAFRGTKLTSVVIPDSVTSFGGAFCSIRTLTSATIGSGVTSLEDGSNNWGCFDECSALRNVTYKGTKAQWQALSATKGTSFQVYVPATTIHCSDGDTTF